MPWKSPPGFNKPCSASRNKCVPCPECGMLFTPFSESASGWNFKPHELCIDCVCTCRSQQHKGQNGSPAPSVSSITEHEFQLVSQISAISSPMPEKPTKQSDIKPCWAHTRQAKSSHLLIWRMALCEVHGSSYNWALLICAEKRL